jgi:hypothetical protein
MLSARSRHPDESVSYGGDASCTQIEELNEQGKLVEEGDAQQTGTKISSFRY